MSSVFVVDQQRKPLDPVPPGRARFLLSAGHAAVLHRYPFTVILKERKDLRERTEATTPPTPHPLRVKLDPGSKTTGPWRWSMMRPARSSGLPNSRIGASR
jgi:hypothetical protein